MSFIGEYDLIINPYRNWGIKSRPIPENVKYVPYFKENHYDFMIAHVDQQSIYNPELGDRIHKGLLYQEIVESFRKTNPDKPIVTINHMTPFHDKYESPYVVEQIKNMTKGTHVIVNSQQASKQWGFGEPIFHGLEVDEWWDLPKEPRVITVLSPAGMEKAYRRVFLTSTIRHLNEMGVPFKWVGVDVKPQSFDEYREYIGRSLVFFMPTWQSPRPRARTEAMLSGACIVTTPYQDAHTFIDHGENGFLTSQNPNPENNQMDNPHQTAKLLKYLVMESPDEAIRIGQAGKKTARELFPFSRFEEQWRDLLKRLGVLK